MSSGGLGTPTPPGERVGMGARKSQIIQEEDDMEEEDIEEVDTFSPTEDKSPTFTDGRNSMDPEAAFTVTIEHQDTAETSHHDTTSGSAAEPEQSTASGASLLPPVEIKEPPQLPPFQPTVQIEADIDLVHPPRSSSLKERPVGSPGSSPRSQKYDDKPLPPVIDAESGSQGVEAGKN